ncbi:TPA: hypothetical protein WIT34_000998 [Neisseria meningitidis]|nr:hypothetical protein [Neisseria meningitidis]DAK40010.1 MAG TPA: hypothetical protein [Bacteriophage sp.]
MSKYRLMNYEERAEDVEIGHIRRLEAGVEMTLGDTAGQFDNVADALNAARRRFPGAYIAETEGENA